VRNSVQSTWELLPVAEIGKGINKAVGGHSHLTGSSVIRLSTKLLALWLSRYSDGLRAGRQRSRGSILGRGKILFSSP
jgi:hypothetical protein